MIAAEDSLTDGPAVAEPMRVCTIVIRVAVAVPVPQALLKAGETGAAPVEGR